MKFIPALLQSKKGQAMLVGVISLVCSNLLGLSESLTKEIVVIVTGYLLGQGIADHGKEAAKVDAAADAAASVPVKPA